jgi:crotonobetainyl-CoA:carnitine CoA-transferase CaiB-like acyl-CoA transferase
MSAYRDVRIVDFSQGLAGPMASMLLGDFEAEVVKIEPPEGDRMADDPGYVTWNRNKQILTLDLEQAGDLARARELIACADVAVFDHAPGELERLGLDGATLTAAHPRLIHAWMPPYGAKGEWSRLPPHHSLLTALTGASFRQASNTDTPVHLVLPLAWYGQAVAGAGAIGAALYERSQSGRGQSVTISGLHGLSAMSSAARAAGSGPLPRGRPQGLSPSYKSYRCADGQWFFLGALFAPFYRSALIALGLGQHVGALSLDPPLARQVLQDLFLTQPREHWLKLLQAADVTCAPVGSREAWFAGDAVEAGGMRLTLEHPRLGPVSMPNVPVRLSETPASVRGLARPGAPDWSPPPASASPEPAPIQRPLAGVRILDLGTVIAGAYAGAILASFGAEVIKVEPIEGDPFRSDGGSFLSCNRGKRGLGIDLKQPAARELFYELARQCDVVIDNYRLGVRERLSIDYATLKAINPRLISCSVTAYGDGGPKASVPGFDGLLQAESGMMTAQGGVGEPVIYTIPACDMSTGVTAAFGVIAALNARNRTGEGQEVRTSLMAQSLTFQSSEITAYQGRPAPDQGGPDCIGLTALRRFYACADGWLALYCERADEALALGSTLGVEVGDPAEALTAPREGALADAIAAELARRPLTTALADLDAAGVAAAPALRGAEAFESDWLWDNGYYQFWSHPRLGEMIAVRGYADFSRAENDVPRPTPDAGEHTIELLLELGQPPERIAALLESGAVFQPVTLAMAY